MPSEGDARLKRVMGKQITARGEAEAAFERDSRTSTRPGRKPSGIAIDWGVCLPLLDVVSEERQQERGIGDENKDCTYRSAVVIVK